MLTLLERLTANERAAYVLREAFDYPYAQIADVLQAQGARGAPGSSAGHADASRASAARA